MWSENAEDSWGQVLGIPGGVIAYALCEARREGTGSESRRGDWNARDDRLSGLGDRGGGRSDAFAKRHDISDNDERWGWEIGGALGQVGERRDDDRLVGEGAA